MPITYTRLPNGTLFDAASLNDRFTDVESSLNNLKKSDVERGALGRGHLPSLVTAVDETTIQVAGAPYYHQYTRDTSQSAYPGWGASSGSWTVIDSDGEAGGGTDLEVTFSAVDTTDAKYGGLLVLANIQVRSVRSHAGPPATQSDYYGIFAIQAYAGSTWYHISRTERYVRGDTITGMTSTDLSNEQGIWFDVPIRTLIKASDVSNESVTKVRGVAAIARCIGSASASATDRLRLNRCTLSVIGLHGSLS